MMKLPEQFKRLMLDDTKELTEKTGERLAEWAMGGERQKDRRDILDLAREAAAGGSDVFKKFWTGASREERVKIESIGPELAKIRGKADKEQSERSTEGDFALT
jgi:hypothetical protein